MYGRRTSDSLLAHLVACLWPLGQVAWNLFISVPTTRAVLACARHVSLDKASILFWHLDLLPEPASAPLG